MLRMFKSLFLASLFLGGCAGADPDLPSPPDAPEVLGAGTISLADRHEFCASMTRDRQTVFIGIEHGDWQSLQAYRWQGGAWVGPEDILGSPDYPAHDPYLTADERRLYFITRVNDQSEIAYLERGADGGLSDPRLLGPPVNSPSHEYYTSFTDEGDIIFASDRMPTQQGDFDIYRAAPAGAGYAQPVAFPETINSAAYEGDPYIDPEGRYLIFASNRADGRGRGDLYLSLATADGGWSDPIAFDDSINTEAHQLCPLVSLDGSAFLFTSDQDIYWVSTAVIEAMIAAHFAMP